MEQQSSTMNVKGNRQVIVAKYTEEYIFKIPDGLDLQDKSVVESYGIKWNVLYINWTDKNKPPTEIESSRNSEHDHKFPDNDLEPEDASKYDFEYEEDEVEEDICAKCKTDEDINQCYACDIYLCVSCDELPTYDGDDHTYCTPCFKKVSQKKAPVKKVEEPPAPVKKVEEPPVPVKKVEEYNIEKNEINGKKILRNDLELIIRHHLKNVNKTITNLSKATIPIFIDIIKKNNINVVEIKNILDEKKEKVTIGDKPDDSVKVGDMYSYGYRKEDFARVVKLTPKQIHYVIIKPAMMNERYDDNHWNRLWETCGTNPDNEIGTKIYRDGGSKLWLRYDGFSIVKHEYHLYN